MEPQTPDPTSSEHAGATPEGAEGGEAASGLGLTRVTFCKGGHTFEFRCETGFEASLARCVMEMARDRRTPLEPGDAFGLCRQILSLGAVPGESAGGASQDVNHKPRDGEGQTGRRKAA